MQETMTIRVDAKTKRRLEKLANATARTKSYLAAEAIRAYLDMNEWQIQEIKATVQEADTAGPEDFIPHEKVREVVAQLGYKAGAKGPVMALVWFRRAVHDLEALRAYLAQENPTAAEHLVFVLRVRFLC